MLLEALKPGTLPGANGDDAFLAVVQHLAVADGKQQTSGDTTDAGVQLQALAHYGVSARLVQTADFAPIEEQLARGIPVPCGTIHRGRWSDQPAPATGCSSTATPPPIWWLTTRGGSRIWSAAPPSTPTGWGCASRGRTSGGGGWWSPSVAGYSVMRRAGGGRWWMGDGDNHSSPG
jgi:hypothetical protein